MDKPESPTTPWDDALEQKLASLGELLPAVFMRMRPALIEETLVFWPANAIGRLRLVRRDGALLFVTQGLGYRFNDLHADQPEPLRYELGIQLRADEPVDAQADDGRTFADLEGADLANTWPVRLLWFLADTFVYERWPLRAKLERFGMMTTVAAPQPELPEHVTPQGFLGLLVGVPLDGQADDTLPDDSRLVMLQLLRPEEYDWVVAVPDPSRCQDLLRRLQADGWPAISSAKRPPLV
ncbi:MAG: suppressor of fused domain protein [Deltaproteobacteria bacterium]|jgi:hypothetical protein|nr:suppressor of fused domain protein [Deltaproteobacteria bacterium]MBW2530622.1 suppressor of fused domain protein [Deltaproteobacteria bacterium]